TVQVNETNPTGITVSKKDLAAQIELKYSEDLKVVFSSKLAIFSTLDPAVKDNNQGLFGIGLFNQAQVCCTYNLKSWVPLRWKLQGGLVLNYTPVKMATQVQFKIEGPINGVQVSGTVTGTVALYLGLSRAAWKAMVTRIGRSAVKVFTEGISEELAAALIDAG